MEKTHHCPICQSEVIHSDRYPKQVCGRCQNRTSDAYGRRVKFFNEDFSGGLRAIYLDTQAVYPHHICYIDGIKCFATENYFGGVVVQVVNRQPL